MASTPIYARASFQGHIVGCSSVLRPLNDVPAEAFDIEC